MNQVESIVVGAGVVGLAVARALAIRGRDVLLLDEANEIGTGISSRSSEVIHAGIYYTPGSLKASLCVEGKARLYAYCAQHDIGHARCGKLIVAADESERAELERICTNAAANDVTDLVLLSQREALAIEPAIACRDAMLSPSTGIVDSHGLMLAYLGDMEDAGGMFARNCRVERIAVAEPGFAVQVAGERDALYCRELINAAGLGAIALAHNLDGLPVETIPQAYFAQGRYFRCAAKVPFTHLIYPLPQPGGLGIHLTLDLDGKARFGPDVHWIEQLDYGVDPALAPAFETSIKQYWPGLPSGSLRPDYAGVRPKLAGPGMAAADFKISDTTDHGLLGYVGLYGLESPGLTASLAIADAVLDALQR